MNSCPFSSWYTFSRSPDFGPKKIVSNAVVAAVLTVAVAAPTVSFAQWLGRAPVLVPLVVGTPRCCCLAPLNTDAPTYPWWGSKVWAPKQRLSRGHSDPHSFARTKQRIADVGANVVVRPNKTRLKQEGAPKLDEREALYQQFLEWLKNQSAQRGRH